jgi:hypothetical protein
MENKVNFIKIFDKQIAETLINGGFLYIKEKVNDNQDVYTFEKSDALIKKLGEISASSFETKVFVEDGTLNF